MKTGIYSKDEKKIIFISCSGHFLVHTLILIFPAIVTPVSREFGLDFAETIKISFPMYLIYGLGAFPFGLITDHLKPKTSFVIYFGGTFLFSFLASLSRTPLQLQLYLALLGVFLSMYHPMGLGLISTNIRRIGPALGLNGIFGSLGLAVAPFIAGIINFFYGWRKVYSILSVLPLGMLIYTILEKSSTESNIKKSKKLDGGNGEQLKAQTVAFFILMFSMMLSGFVYRGQNIVLPTYFEKKVYFLFNILKGINISNISGSKTLSATLLTSLVYFISIFGQILGGRVADKYELRYSYLIFFTISLPFLILMFFTDNILLLISAVGFVLFSIGMQPIENSLVAKFTPSKWRNTSYGLKFVVTFGVGSTVIYPVGYIQERFSLNYVFLLFTAVILVLIMNDIFLILYTNRKLSKLVTRNN